MLFSEPKIPQSLLRLVHRNEFVRFSALQRAENSSIAAARPQHTRASRRFSALQRAENSSIRWEPRDRNRPEYGFSALQRAENSSICRKFPVRR